MIRSLVFAAQNFGMSPPGVHRSNLRGSEQLDGTVFVRVRLHRRSNIGKVDGRADLLLGNYSWQVFC